MKVTGIIAEYNPFHNGHEYHLNMARESTGCDYVVVVMSGNYVQRGAPTIIDKYARCEMALRCGADLVLELPACFSTASAEYFAYGGVVILEKLGCVDSLSFGTESLDGAVRSEEAAAEINSHFSEIADLLINETDEFKEILRTGLRNGLSHAAATAAAVGEILGEEDRRILETSNNILGVEYIKAIKRSGSSIKPVPVARMLASHTDRAVMDGFSSATAIRNAIYNSYDMTSLASTVPPEAFDILMDRYLVSFPVFRDDFSMILGSKIISAGSPEVYRKYFGINEDLANRIFNHKNEFKSFNQFRELIGCKNIAKATVGRALMHITLDIMADDINRLYNKESLKAVKVLGFKESAAPLLSAIKQNGSIQLVTKLADYTPENKNNIDMIEQTTRADMFYRMVCMNKYNVDIKTPWENSVIILPE